MVDYIFYILLALSAMQPGGDMQVELYSDYQLQYRAVAQPTESGFTLSVVDSALDLRQIAWTKRDAKGFEIMDEGAEEPRRIDLFLDLPGWTQKATSGEKFSVDTAVGVIKGSRSGSKLTLTLNSEIDTIIVQPYED
jgi:hypothetical protein